MNTPTGKAKGAAARAASLSPERRKEIAEQAVAARKAKAAMPRVIKKGDDYSVELEEQTVQAFAGQQKAADVVVKAVETAGTLGAAAIAAP